MDMAANTTLTTPGLTKRRIEWLARLAERLRPLGVQSVSLPDVTLTFHPMAPSHAAETLELDLAEQSRAASKADPLEPYLASGLVPVNIRALRDRKRAGGE